MAGLVLVSHMDRLNESQKKAAEGVRLRFRADQRAYAKSDAGKAASHRYNVSNKGRAKMRKYIDKDPEHFKALCRKNEQGEKVQAYRKQRKRDQKLADEDRHLAAIVAAGEERPLFDDSLAGKQYLQTVLDECLAKSFDGKTIQAWLDSGAGVYIGSTKREVKEEALKFLTERSGTHSNPHLNAEATQQLRDEREAAGLPRTLRGRPIVVWKLPTEQSPRPVVITPTQAVSQLGFQYFPVWRNVSMSNVRTLESRLQTEFMSYPVGCRLWRKIFQTCAGEDGDHSVYIAVCPQLSVFLAEGRVMLQE